MDMIAAYREMGTYRGAAAMCGCDPKTIKRALARLAAGEVPARRKEPKRNYDVVGDVVAARVSKKSGKISAKRLLAEARAAGYAGSARNFRRAGGQGEGRLASQPSPGPPSGGVGAGRHAGDRLGVGGPATRVLRGAGLVAVAVRALRRR